MEFQHQDWKPVVFHKKNVVAKKESQKAVSQLMSKQERALLDESNDGFTIKKFERDFIQRVISERVARKMSQKDLAMLLKENVSKINNFEQGKEVYDAKLKDRLQRFLQSPKPSSS